MYSTDFMKKYIYIGKEEVKLDYERSIEEAKVNYEKLLEEAKLKFDERVKSIELEYEKKLDVEKSLFSDKIESSAGVGDKKRKRSDDDDDEKEKDFEIKKLKVSLGFFIILKRIFDFEYFPRSSGTYF